MNRVRRSFALVVLGAASCALIQLPATANGAPGGSTPPSISGISPNYGAGAGGTPVRITGRGFSTTPGATEFVGSSGDPVFTDVSCSTTTRCTAVTLPGNVDDGELAQVNVLAVVNGVQSAEDPADTFTWYGEPVLTEINPASGSSRGGFTVGFEGGAFPGGTATSGRPGPITVLFGTRPGRNVDCEAVDVCTVIVPSGSGTVQVTVTTPGGTSGTAPFTYTGLTSRP